jgi:hypothetical protein
MIHPVSLCCTFGLHCPPVLDRRGARELVSTIARALAMRQKL